MVLRGGRANSLNPGTAASHDLPSYRAFGFLETVIGLLGSAWVLLALGCWLK